MKAHTIFKKVGGILAEINEQYQYLSESPEKLNELELELFSANADFLAEHIKVLKKLNPALDNPVKVEGELPEDITLTDEYKESVNAPEKVENADHLLKQDLPDSYSSFHKPIENELPAARAAIEEVQKITTEPPVTQPDSIPEPVPEPAPVPQQVVEPIRQESSFSSFFTPEVSPVSRTEPPAWQTPPVVEEVVSETPKDATAPEVIEITVKVPTINEIMSAQRAQSNDINKANKEQPVSDLKSIISLNDKLLFIKDLFNGYSLAYSEAIEIINRFDSFAAADNFLKANYSAKNNWASKQATADKFYELINRRFPK